MRKLLLSLTVIAGAVAAAAGAQASVPVAQPIAVAQPAVLLGAPAHVETVQYYYGDRGRHYRRAYYHHREWRRWHHRGRW